MAYGILILILARPELKIEQIGQFGDSFGVLTALFTALAFAAVIATVVLQSRELRESRIQLKKQAEAQSAWAAAATKQIELTTMMESIKVQPIIKVEWHPLGEHAPGVYLRMRNVGLGAAVIESIEIVARGKRIGFVDSSDDPDAEGAWTNAINEAIGSQDFGASKVVRMRTLTDLNRALAPAEHQGLVEIGLTDWHFVGSAISVLEKHLRPVIRFRSLSGQVASTESQFAIIRGYGDDE